MQGPGRYGMAGLLHVSRGAARGQVDDVDVFYLTTSSAILPHHHHLAGHTR